MKTFKIIKKTLEEQGIKLTSGRLVDRVESICTSLDSLVEDIWFMVDDLSDELEKKANKSNQKKSPDQDLLNLLRLYYGNNVGADGCPKRTIFNDKVLSIFYRNVFHEWWAYKTRQDLYNMPKHPEFYVFHSGKDVAKVMLEFLSAKPYVLKTVQAALDPTRCAR